MEPVTTQRPGNGLPLLSPCIWVLLGCHRGHAGRGWYADRAAVCFSAPCHNRHRGGRAWRCLVGAAPGVAFHSADRPALPVNAAGGRTALAAAGAPRYAPPDVRFVLHRPLGWDIALGGFLIIVFSGLAVARLCCPVSPELADALKPCIAWRNWRCAPYGGREAITSLTVPVCCLVSG